MNNFELNFSTKAYGRIPLSEYVSKKTGLSVILAEVEGPIVTGYFCLATEALDDDGLPHILEHLIFLGSEDYPYKGVLDLLANRCLACGTNAGTALDFTVFKLETAGSDGLLSLLPIFLDHILFPTLRDESFITEVHHITSDGTDAGVVYCEMQGRENSAESRLHLTVARNIYPMNCGYAFEVGGLLKNLRESSSIEKVREFHRKFYRPDNLKLLISGKIEQDRIFKALEQVEDKIISKGKRSNFIHPWQNDLLPITYDSKDIVINYPSDEEKNGLFCIAWRGASNVKEYYFVQATILLMNYLSEFSNSPLQRQLVQIKDPYGSKVFSTVNEYSEICLAFILEDVPLNKLCEVGSKVKGILKTILKEKLIDMDQLHNTIKKYKVKQLSTLENSPHGILGFIIISYMLYGQTHEDLKQRINPFINIKKLLKEPQSFWLELLHKYLVSNKTLTVQCVPSIEEKQKLAKEEQERVELQRKKLGEHGLKEQGELLTRAIEFNERIPPREMVTCIPIPEISCIKFHDIKRYESDGDLNQRINLSQTPVFTYFDHVESNFTYIYAALDTSNVPVNLKIYLPLLLESLFGLPIERDGRLIPDDEIASLLNEDTVSVCVSLGLQRDELFECGSYSSTAVIILQVETEKYEIGINWLKELLYKTVFTIENVNIVAKIMFNSAAQYKRSGKNLVDYVMNGLIFNEHNNIHLNSVLEQSNFLSRIIDILNGVFGYKIIQNLEILRRIITDPSNVVLYIAGNLNYLKNPIHPINNFLPPEISVNKNPTRLKVTPDYIFKKDSKNNLNGCILGMASLESSFFIQTTSSLFRHNDPDLPALMLYIQYLTQMEGPLWKRIRGKGYCYYFRLMLKIHEGLLCLIFSNATNVFGAYQETRDYVLQLLNQKEFDNSLLESAKSSIMFKIINEEKTVGKAVHLSFISSFDGVEFYFNRKLLDLINKVSADDLAVIGEKYIRPLFNPGKVKTAIVCDSAKIYKIADGFKKLNMELTIYNSLEESFLNKMH